MNFYMEFHLFSGDTEAEVFSKILNVQYSFPDEEEEETNQDSKDNKNEEDEPIIVSDEAKDLIGNY